MGIGLDDGVASQNQPEFMTTPPTTTATRTFIDQISGAWYTSPEPAWIGAGLVGSFQCFMTYRMLDLTTAASVLPTSWWVALCTISIAFLLVRRRWPLVTTTATALVLLTAGLVLPGAHNYYIYPLLMSIYALTSRASIPKCLTGVSLAAFCLVLPGVLDDKPPGGILGAVIPTMFLLTIVVAIALAFRARRGVLHHRDTELAAQARQHELTGQRDAARRQARIAAELHDSVGHDLTAIVSLSEGLRGVMGRPELEEAIDAINALARDGLSDTRRAVDAIHPTSSVEAASDLPGVTTTTHGWDDLEPLLTTTRRTGLVVAFTRTGSPPADPVLAGLAFTIIREALTNVMRHAKEATRVTVAVDHTPAATTIIITDDGQAAGSGTPGHGLANLTRLVNSRGGMLTAGPTPDGWCLHVVLPKEQT